jgi:hypothetical protein
VALLEVGDQSRAGRFPPEQVARDLCRRGTVESPEAAEEAEVFPDLLGGDGDCGDVEMFGEDLGDLADRDALMPTACTTDPAGADSSARRNSCAASSR